MASNTTFHRCATAVEATVMVLAIVTLGLASAYGVQLSKAPLYFRLSKETLHIQWSTAWVVFFYGTIPVATIFAAFAGILLYLFGKATPRYGVIISTIFLLGWIVTVALWSSCHYWNRDVDLLDFCYQKNLWINGGYVGLSEGLAISMTVFSAFSIITYLFYMIYASLALHKMRRAKPAFPADYEMSGHKSDGSTSMASGH
ncbi:MAG: hypothetical protein M1813_005558 [Trichoglossum hirsutum]|nr:MAG: hypothetical protein M1813_005558 [Trichoglossum hirsutum]